jgi:hypothetical protein
MDPIIILDDVFHSEGDQHELHFIAEGIDHQGEWRNWNKYGDNMETYYWLLAHKASSYYDIQQLKGMEMWTHLNTRPQGDIAGGWHYDKDEHRWATNKILSFPVCSLVYYTKVDKLYGGRLLFRDVKITPKTNRLIIFGPGRQHRVETYTGTRCSLNINLWNRKLEEYDL